MRSCLRSTLFGLTLLALAGCEDASAPTNSGKPTATPGWETRPRAAKEARKETGPTPEETKAAREIIDRAVQATAGSPERLEKLRAYVLAGKGTMWTAGGEIPCTREAEFQFPDALRLAAVQGEGEAAVKPIMVVQGRDGWMQRGFEPPADLPAEFAVDIGNVLYVYWLATLLPLKDDSVTCAPLPAPVAGVGQTAIVVRQRGRPDVALHFDAKSGLLARLSYYEPVDGARKELQFSAHREFEGLKLPTREVELWNDRRRAEWANSEYRFPAKIDPTRFEKPKQ